MKTRTKIKLIFFIFGVLTVKGYAQTLPIDLNDGWKMTWNDEFDYPDSELEKNWKVQNGKSGGGIVISSRWRENCVVKDGVLHLIAKKESRGGQDWTAGSVWTKREFLYGYMECRYKYAEAPGLNNAFWTWNSYASDYPYELDMNEGHYPNVINTNYHDRRDTVGLGFKGVSESITYRPNGGPELKPYYSHEFEKPLMATKVRFRSKSVYPITMNEFRIYAPNKAGYPKNVRSDNADTEVAGLKNIARLETTTIYSSGYDKGRADNCEAKNLVDGKISGRGTSWSSPHEINKWVEFQFGVAREIGCIQLVAGWNYKGHWRAMLDDYEIEYYDGRVWTKVVDFSQAGDTDYSAEYHVYGMLWGEDELTYYFDGEPIRTIKYKDIKNPVLSPTKIYLSLAVLNNSIGLGA